MSSSSQDPNQPQGTPQRNPQQQQQQSTSGSAPSGLAPSGSTSSTFGGTTTTPTATGLLTLTSASSYVLVAPIMGGLEYVSSTDQMAWTGGKPNTTLTGLDA